MSSNVTCVVTAGANRAAICDVVCRPTCEVFLTVQREAGPRSDAEVMPGRF
jgi:hypothetical protein